MPHIIGIDLGTTNSLVAVMEGGVPTLIANSMGDVLTPSVVAVTSTDEVLVGRAAREIAAAQPASCQALFKRSMGTAGSYRIGEHEMTPQMLSSLVLRSLSADAERYLGVSVSRAVITVPAYFNDAQRQATKDAAEMAGLEVLRILNEPTAAALAYGLHVDPAPRKLLVFDLGGGTFDVSILDCEDGVLEVMASAGEAFLGGEDFTRNLMARLLARHEIALADLEVVAPLLVAKFRYRVELAKQQLSCAPEVTVAVPDPKADSWTVLALETVTSRDLASANRELLDRFQPVTWRALRDAELSPDDVDEVLLVGGASRMRVVSDFIEKVFGKAPRIAIDPDTVVARGAAVQAALVAGDAAVADIIATDVMPHTLGTEVCKDLAGVVRDGYYMPVIDRNTTIPVSRVTSVSTIYDGQTEIQLNVFQGESRLVKDNLCLGKLTVAGIPARPRGREALEVRFTYDLNGILEVEARVVSTGKNHRLVLQERPGKLSQKELQLALRTMKDLKVDLRDTDANRFLLEKSRRVYSEIAGFHRQRLSELMDGFEAALIERVGEEIEAFRTELEIFLSLHDSSRYEGGEDAADGSL